MIQTTSPVAKARTEQAECWPGPRGYSDAPQATSLSSCCIVVFPTDSDIQHCGAEVKVTSFDVRQTGLASYLHHFLAM